MPVQAPKIHQSSTPRFPQFAFEWHEATGRVYCIEIPGRWIDGVFVRDDSRRTANGISIAEHCEHHARFFGFVQTWLRGVRMGESNPRPPEAQDVNSYGIAIGCERENTR